MDVWAGECWQKNGSPLKAFWVWVGALERGKSDSVDWQAVNPILLRRRAQTCLSLHLSLEVPASELEVTGNFQAICSTRYILWVDEMTSTYSSAPLLYQLTWKSWPAQPPLLSFSILLLLCLTKVNKGEQSITLTVPQLRLWAHDQILLSQGRPDGFLIWRECSYLDKQSQVNIFRWKILIQVLVQL